MSDIRKPGFPRNTQQQFREIDVPDASDFEASIEEENALIREHQANSQRSKQSSLSDAVKRRIEHICGITRETRDVTIGDTTFVLKTLKSKETKDAIMQLAKHDGTMNLPFETRRQFLARAIDKIAGMDVNVFLGTNNFNAILEFIDELEETIVTKLYSEFQILSDLVTKKYQPQTEAEAKEVVEDIKK